MGVYDDLLLSLLECVISLTYQRKGGEFTVVEEIKRDNNFRFNFFWKQNAIKGKFLSFRSWLLKPDLILLNLTWVVNTLNILRKENDYGKKSFIWAKENAQRTTKKKKRKEEEQNN